LLILTLALILALAGLVFIRNLIDFPVYYAAGRSLIAGRADLYAPDFARGAVMDFRYPPFFLVAFLPLWLLPYSAAAYVWYLFSLVQIGICVCALRRSLGGGLNRGVWLVSLLGAGQYFIMVLHYGNAHLLSTSLLFAAAYFVLRRRTLPAAFLLAASITMKLTPILFVPYLAVKRRWKEVGLIAAFLVMLNLLPAFYFGFGPNLGLLKSWYSHVIADQEFHEENGPINLSLKGELRRYLTEIDYSRRVDGDTDYRRVNLASINRDDSDKIWMIVSAVLYLAGLVFVAFTKAKDTGENADQMPDLERLEIGLMICLMLFVGPLTSKIYFIALLWPFACLAFLSFRTGSTGGGLLRKLVIGAAVFNVLLPLLPGRSIQRLLLVLGVDFYLNCLLAVLLVCLMIGIRLTFRRQSVAPQSPDL
jgi:glycosyl transferase family 87